MKSLDQIEARTPISALPITINAAGSYYLTGNLNVTAGDGITITANQVTVDLNGFTISSTANPAAGTAIRLQNGSTDITILNGRIKGGITFSVGTGTFTGDGFQNGISFSGMQVFNVRVSGLSISGVQQTGINLGVQKNGNIVESCNVQTAGNGGIMAAVVSRSVANLCGFFGISAASSASDCIGNSNLGTGLSASVAINCAGRSFGNSTGLDASSATNCTGVSADGFGLNATTAVNCYGISDTSNGIHAFTVTGCYGQSGSNRGISADIATSSMGFCQLGVSFGMNITHIATNCYGFSSGGVGLATYIANSCRGENNIGPSVSANFKYNMP